MAFKTGQKTLISFTSSCSVAAQMPARHLGLHRWPHCKAKCIGGVFLQIPFSMGGKECQATRQGSPSKASCAGTARQRLKNGSCSHPLLDTSLQWQLALDVNDGAPRPHTLSQCQMLQWKLPHRVPGTRKAHIKAGNPNRTGAEYKEMAYSSFSFSSSSLASPSLPSIQSAPKSC